VNTYNNKDKIWRLKDNPPNATWLARSLGISNLTASLLLNRNVTTIDSAKSFLSPRLGDLRDPFLLRDMDRAVEMITAFIIKREKITVYGDYDVDGITATSLLVDFFLKLGVPTTFYIPDRLKEGYSLNEEAVEKIANTGTGLLITVDCGISSLKEITLAKKLGMEVVVTDHHKIPSNFKAICPAVDPSRSDSSFPFKDLAGVGLSFYLAVAVRSSLRNAGFFKGTHEPDLKSYLDLVALGTVADVVPLLEENRIFVKKGLAILRESRRPGIRALLKVAGIKEDTELTTHDVAFKIAPRINAAGRLGSASSAVHLFLTDDEIKASLIAERMDYLNTQRQGIQNKIVSESRDRLKKMDDLEQRRAIVLYDSKWHRGVVGIVASRITEEYNRPTFVLSAEGELLKGSGRSIDGFDLYGALSQLSDILQQFGGHSHAAGVSLKYKDIREFCERFEGIARSEIDADDMVQKIDADARISPESINPQTVKEIERLLPFGQDNPQPIFWAGPFNVLFSKVVGKNHLKLRLKAKGIIFDCIAFGMADNHPMEGKSVDILFNIEINKWRGTESIQLVIIDLHFV